MTESEEIKIFKYCISRALSELDACHAKIAGLFETLKTVDKLLTPEQKSTLIGTNEWQDLESARNFDRKDYDEEVESEHGVHSEIESVDLVEEDKC